MQEVLNPLKTVNPVQAINFSSNAKLGARSSGNNTQEKGAQAKDNADKGLNSAFNNIKAKLVNANRKLSQSKNDTDTSVKEETSFDKTLSEKASTAKDDELDLAKEDLKEISKDLLDALIAFLQQMQNMKSTSEEDLAGLNLDQSLSLAAVSLDDITNFNTVPTEALIQPNTLAVNANLSLETNLENSLVSELGLNSNPLAVDIDANSMETKLQDLIDKLIQETSLKDQPEIVQLTVLTKLTDALEAKLQDISENLNKQIENIRLNDVSLKHLEIDPETNLPKLHPELDAKLDRVIKLGEKTEKIDQLLNLVSHLDEALKEDLKEINPNYVSAASLQEDADLGSDFNQLLESFNLGLDEEDGVTGLTNETEIVNVNLETETAISMESMPLSQERQRDNDNLLFSKELKTVINKNPEQLNTVMKAAELLRSLPDLAKETSPNSSRELNIRLNPEELGTVDVTITKTSSQQISIQLNVTNEAAEKTLRHKLNELTNALSEKGVSITDVNITKSESNSANDRNPDGKNSFNEGREEQKRRQEENQREREQKKAQYSFQTELFSILR